MKGQYILRIKESSILYSHVNGGILMIMCLLVVLPILGASFESLINITPLIFYLSIIILFIINWNKSKYLRTGSIFVGTMTLLALIICMTNPLYFSNDLSRLILVSLAVITLANVNFEYRYMQYISKIMFVVLLILFIKSFGYIDLYNRELVQSMSETLANPNSKGIVTLLSFMIASRGDLLKNNFIGFVTKLITFIALINYNSRASLLCFIIYIIFMLLRKNINKYRQRTYKIVVLASTLFPLVYMLYYFRTNQNTKTIILGKSIFSGRQDLWKYVFDITDSFKILIGNSNDILIRYTSTSNWHNMYIAIMYKYGIIFLILFLLMLYKAVILNKNIAIETYASIICIMIFGSFETTFINGGFDSILILFLFINFNILSDIPRKIPIKEKNAKS